MNYIYDNKRIVFDKIYEIKEIVFESDVKSVSWAINEEIINNTNLTIKGNLVTFDRIYLRYLYLDEPNKIKDIKYNKEYIISEDYLIDNVFRRNEGWAGADGIFSHVYGDKIHWYFSDTLVGKVDPETRLREEMFMVNNTVGISLIDDPFNIMFLVNKDGDKYTSFYTPEKEGYYWLQDGEFKDNYLYISVIRVKDDKANWFEVLDSEMIKIKVNEDSTLDYENYQRFSNATYFEQNNQIYTFGAAMLDDTSRTGYYYMFGYDNAPDKNLYMIRVTDFEDNDTYEYFTISGWCKTPTNFKSIGKHVANEMRVIYDGQYIISYTVNCSSPTIELASTDCLEEGFKDRQIVYQCKESVLADSIITYNAKLHTFPFEKDDFITYNVNTTVIKDLVDADIYYPRWLRLEKESD